MPIRLKDVASAASVSLSTASRALSNDPRVSVKTSQRIQRLAEEMGYRPSAIARSLATNRTNNLGVLVSDVTDPFVAELVRCINLSAFDHGYNTFLVQRNDDLSRNFAVADSLLQGQVAAIIIADPYVNTSVLLSLKKSEIPLVFINNRKFRYSIGTDNVLSGQMAVDHLLDLGHERIAYVGSVQNKAESVERKTGYERALRARGISVDPSLIILGSQNPWGEIGQQCVRKLQGLSEPPTAYFCFNDSVAIGAMAEICASSYRIPDDISVIGFDDINVNPYLFPPLTSVAQHKEFIAWTAVEMALCLVERKEPAPYQLLPGILKVRKTTGPILK